MAAKPNPKKLAKSLREFPGTSLFPIFPPASQIRKLQRRPADMVLSQLCRLRLERLADALESSNGLEARMFVRLLPKERNVLGKSMEQVRLSVFNNINAIPLDKILGEVPRLKEILSYVKSVAPSASADFYELDEKRIRELKEKPQVTRIGELNTLKLFDLASQIEEKRKITLKSIPTFQIEKLLADVRKSNLTEADLDMLNKLAAQSAESSQPEQQK
jgi:hypothetical protein